MLITILVNGHREGRLLGAALRSARGAADFARLPASEFEVLLVLDKPDDVTLRVAEQCRPLIDETLVVDHGDLGAARNSGVAHASGEALALLDGDDLWGRSWLSKGLPQLDSRGDVVLHPQISQYFGEDFTAWQSPCMSNPNFRVTSVLGDNPWTSLAMAPTSIFRRHPYRPTPADHRYGYEDWAWNCDTLASGIQHRIVPQTVHYVRRRVDSLSRKSLGARALPIRHNLTLERALELDRIRERDSP